MAGMNSGEAYEFDPETYGGEGGGLPGMLQRYMQQQGQQQEGVDFGSTPTGAPEYNSDTFFSPQGGLFGRLLSLQAEQNRYQPVPATEEPTPSAPQYPDFRQVSQAPVAVPPQGAVGSSNPPDDQSNPAHSPLDADLVAQPERSLSDRLQAWWDHPDPHGLVAVLKGAANGVVQGVQGSIDATSTPSTEEEAFRQNLGRELGPMGALKAASLRAPLTPAGTGGIFATGTGGILASPKFLDIARGVANLLESRAASSAVAGINPLSPKPAVPQEWPTGGLPGSSGGNPMLQWPFP
jgi:hypothetical protein